MSSRDPDLKKLGTLALGMGSGMELSDVKSKGQQVQFSLDFALAPEQKTAESVILLDDTEGALHHDGALDPELDPSLGR